MADRSQPLTFSRLPQDQAAKHAWIGDAVLSLYVRLKILDKDGVLDGEKSIRMTSNRFLSSLGQPTRVEAEIGLVFEQAGLPAAFAWIEEHLMPLFIKQEEKRDRQRIRFR